MAPAAVTSNIIDLSPRRGGGSGSGSRGAKRTRARAASIFVAAGFVLCLSFLLLLQFHYIGNSDGISAGMVAAAEAVVADAGRSDAADTAPDTSATKKLPKYDPLKCSKMVNGHCRDEEGGAWSYRKADGTCTHTEDRVPKDRGAVRALPKIFPDVKDGVLDFGGGVGAYMTSFRDAGVKNLVVMEPHDLAGCLFKGLRQERTDLVNTPLSELPKRQYDLVMTIEVCEHFPVEHHPHVIAALTQASRKWLLFSAAHPGQPGEGHVGPSMKWRKEWVAEITEQTHGEWVLDQEKTDELHEASIFSLLKDNAFIMKRKGALGGETTDPAVASAKRELRLLRRR
mmetsp:Transcript_19885/g.42853  ORF Transcript_19885/g.42853 Transcript_19885/m.42853 type:complete len:341 (-) Transcript_19885:92-1114(-)